MSINNPLKEEILMADLKMQTHDLAGVKESIGLKVYL
jgi:hypothetical protein